MKALNIGSGDEVITVPYTFIATVGSTVTAGAKPVFVDTKFDYNMDETLVEKAITKKTKLLCQFTGPEDLVKWIKYILQKIITCGSR